VLTESDVSLTGVRLPVLPDALRFHVLPTIRPGERPGSHISIRHWRQALVIADLLVGIGATLLAVLGRFGVTDPLGPSAPYLILVITGPLLWVALLMMMGAYDERRAGSGAAEFGSIANSGLWMLAIVVGASYITHSELSREVTMVTVLAMTLLSLGTHVLGRLTLRQRIRVGGTLHRALVVGPAPDVRGLVDHISRLPHAGLRVAGVCVTQGSESGAAATSSSAECSVDGIITAARDAGADTIALTGSGFMSGADIRRLSWDLEGTGIRLLVAPSVPELAGPRLVVQPVGGLPLLHVKEAGFSGASWTLKAALDRAGAALLCTLLSPLLAGIAIAIRLDSPGPVLFRQRRVGLHGREFTMLKFRTMHELADQMRDELQPLNEHDGVLFKIREDPRVTRVGRFLRRYSLDELPQLWNVLAGSMSLVGPRPPLQSEVDRYPSDLKRRRLLVKPGMTGLWQVSGRSDLTWEETVRLDLQYVESWSVLLDASVLWKTARAVVTGRGAY
jgi:exopolysaccharide biosynthesis polyprenyl glycosylphosphotransferase